MTYKFTEKQLRDLLYGTIDMFFEYRDEHGKQEKAAKFAAVGEMFEGLDAERELVKEGVERKAGLQIIEEEIISDLDVLDEESVSTPAL